tara:strand:+ start:900 stop:1424 length:525 start_codon:yes stop_codon:yes gene_type:complete
MSKEKEIWQTLSAINVNDHANVKNGFTYLAWTWAWATLQENYPTSSYRFKDDKVHTGGSVEVWCELTVEGTTREMWLAVTDFRNKPVIDPTCDLIANARMRCLVKAIAMFGLGHYIYAGESMPIEPAVQIQDHVVKMINESENLDALKDIWISLSESEQSAYKEIVNKAKKSLS